MERRGSSPLVWKSNGGAGNSPQTADFRSNTPSPVMFSAGSTELYSSSTNLGMNGGSGGYSGGYVEFRLSNETFSGWGGSGK